MNGINLHVDVDDAISHTSFVSLSTGCIPAPGATTVTFDSIKTTAAAFGTDNPRRFAYHYAIAGHFQDPSTTSTGCGELPGNDFLVTLAGFATGPTVQQEAGTFMHEFGHTLNLRHGGDVNNNRKPNYLSIMSYAFQFPGIGPTDPDGTGPLTARLDYSQSDLPDLDETSLSEPTGVQDGTDATRWCCANYTTQTGAATGAIPWNCDGDSTDVGVSQTINCDCTDTNMNGVCNSGEPPILGTLTGFNDWPALKYDFQNTKDYEDGDHTDTTGPEADLVVALCSPDPRGQGYWHRQCLGTGEIRPGRNGRGPSAPTEANFVAQLEPCADARLEDLGFYGTTTCEGMDAVPPSDPCEKALKHLTATVLNVCSGRLADVCPADLATAGCAASTVGDALTEIAAMIQTGNCGQAASCAEVINEGTAVGMPAAAVPPASATLGRDPAPSQAPAGESREWLDLRAHPELIAKYELRRVRGAWDPTGAEYFLVPASAVRRLGIQQPGPTFRLVSPQEERARLNTRLRNADARTDEALKIRLVAGFGPTAERLVLVQENRMRLRWATGESRRYHLVPAAPLAPGQDLVR
jgi:hypothetical protein